MRNVTARWAPAIAKSHRIVSTVTARRGEDPAKNVPILGGDIVFDATARGIRRLNITVPLIGHDKFVWDPGSNPLHPLAEFGQTLTVRSGIEYPDGTTEQLNQGTFLIANTIADEIAGTVTVQATDLIQRLINAPILINPYGAFGPLYNMKEVVDLLMYPSLVPGVPAEPAILVPSMTAMTDRPLHGILDVRESGDRLAALDTIATTWPARMYVDDAGLLRFAPPVLAPAPTSVAQITGGTPTSTMVSRGRSGGRQRAYNRVYAIGINPTTGLEQFRAVHSIGSGPLAVSGPYGYVTRWYTSTLLRNLQDAINTAASLLAGGTLLARSETITCSPNPALELWDTVDVISPRLGTWKGLISSITLPLTSGGGPMTLTVTNKPEE